MKGTIIKRQKKTGKSFTYTYVIDMGRDANGKRQRKWVGGFNRKADAQAALTEAISAINRGANPFPDDMNFRDFALQWLDRRRNDSEKPLRATTAHRYQGLLMTDIMPVIGNLPLRKVRAVHVRSVLDQMRDRGLSSSTIHQARAVLSACMNAALGDELIDSNPVAKVKGRTPTRKSERGKVTAEQVNDLLKTAEGSFIEVPLLIAATTGARRSEVLALRWSDVELENQRIVIRRGLHRLPVGKDERGRNVYETTFLPPKSKKARRAIPLLPEVVQRLQRHRKDQLERRLAAGTAWQDLDLVCDAGDGSPMDPDSFGQSFKRLAARVDLDSSVRLHDLRHGVASQLARKGVHPFMVSRLMGHSSVSFTLDTYTDEWAEAHDDAREALQEMTSGSLKLMKSNGQSRSLSVLE